MSHIRLSKDTHYGPLIPPNRAHVIVGLEPMETIRILADYGNEETTFIVNARPIYPLNVIAGKVEYPPLHHSRPVLEQSGKRLYWMDATEKAVELRGAILLNMIMLGALCGLSDFPLNVEDAKEALQEIFSTAKWEGNYRALEMGACLVS